MTNTTDITLAFKEQLDEFHSHQKPYDDALDIWLHKSYAEVLEKGLKVDWTVTYFSPSSADSCPRALYEKVKKKKRDLQTPQPHQRRWTSLGEGIGDMIQREILLCERHFEKFAGKKPRFTMGIVDDKYPAFEQFIWTQKKVEHEGEVFYLTGTGDGILVDNETGNSIGLEIKSKQQTPSKTSIKGMTSPQISHTKQVITYSIMYDLDTYVVLYYNAAKKGWDLTREEYENTPDMRMFQVDVTEEDKTELLDFFADITRRVRENDPPLPDLTKWRFNDFKTAICESLTDEEVAKLEMVAPFIAEDLPAWQKRSIDEALADIKRRRAELSDR